VTRNLPIAVTILGASAWTAAPVSAQQAQPPPGGIITEAPSQAYAQPAPVYFEYDLEEAAKRSRRARVALISTSAAFVAGLIITGIGASQCEEVHRDYSLDEIRCNTAGDVMAPLGVVMIVSAAVGMITSGAMLGVRNRTKRDIERDLRRHRYGSRLQWDVQSGRLVF
jgi:hypothetical protein